MVQPRQHTFRAVLRYALLLAWLGAVPNVHATHFPWDQGHDTFIPVQGDEDTDPGHDACNATGCPFSVSTGNFFHVDPDLYIPTIGRDIEVTRTYNSRDMRSGPMGHGWSFAYDMRLVETTDGVALGAILHLPNGSRERFVREADGTFSVPADVDLSLVKNTDETFTLTDAAGTERRFDTLGRLTLISDSNGQTLNLSYDADGFPTGISGPAGSFVTFNKGANGKIASMTDLAGRIRSYEYDADGNLVGVVDPAGNRVRYEYDSKHNLVRVFDAAENVSQTASYDSELRVASLTAQRDADEWTVSYSPSQHRTTKTDSQSNVWGFDYNENGNVTEVGDPLGGREAFGYDADFNIIFYRDRNGSATTFTYDSQRRLVGTSDGDTYAYDSTNQVTLATDALENSTSYEYDAAGNLTSIVDALGNSTTRTYDSQGLLVSTTEPLGGTTTFSYDAQGNVREVASPLGNRTTFAHGSLGELLSVTDAEGRRTEYSYVANLLLNFQDNNGVAAVTDPLGNRTSYEYANTGDLTTITDAKGQEVRFSHDSLGRLVRWENDREQTRTYIWDTKGRVTSATDAKRQTTTFTYDALDRLVRKVTPDNTVTFTYDGEGNVTSIVDDDSSLAFVYDGDNRVIEASTATTTIRYAYDANGNRTSMIDPSGGDTSYAYDGLDRLVAVTDPSGESITFAYDARSRRTAMTLPNGTRTTYTYDADDRLLVVDAQGVSGVAYAYDKVGNRTSVTDAAGVHQYTYDSLDRLIGADHANVDVPDEFYVYDAVGNRTASHLSLLYTYDEANRIAKDDLHEYTSDANGNLVKIKRTDNGTVTEFEYDSEDQLIRRIFRADGSTVTSTVAYRYDGLGRRIEKDVGGQVTRYVYDGSDVLLEFDGDNQIRYTHGPGHPQGRFLSGATVDEPLIMERGGQRYYYHADGSGSITHITNSGGSVVNSYVYDAFGRILEQTTEGVTNPYTFTGRERDPESGLYYYRARYYHPEIGRFLSEDLVAHGMFRARAGWFPAPFPILLEPGELNLYVYAHNNPVNLVDPQGLGDGEWGKLPGTDIDYRIDWSEQPAPDMHVYWKDGTETNITSDGGWRRGKQRGKGLVSPRKQYRKALRKVVKPFVKKAGKLVPVTGIAFWMLDANAAYGVTQEHCSSAGDYVNLLMPYQDVGTLFK